MRAARGRSTVVNIFGTAVASPSIVTFTQEAGGGIAFAVGHTLAVCSARLRGTNRLLIAGRATPSISAVAKERIGARVNASAMAYQKTGGYNSECMYAYKQLLS